MSLQLILIIVLLGAATSSASAGTRYLRRAGRAAAEESRLRSLQSPCITKIYGTADEAKTNYVNDCGQIFEHTNEFRCDWVPGGWQCSGPGASSTGQLLPAPVPSPVPETIQPQSAPDNDGHCLTNVYPTAEEAKEKFMSDCGRTFQSTLEFRCDWVTGGWQCSGPGASTGQLVPEPVDVIIESPVPETHQPQPASGSIDQCLTNVYPTAEEAKENYVNDCGRTFQSTSAFRCDWVTGGWQCSGPVAPGVSAGQVPAPSPVAVATASPVPETNQPQPDSAGHCLTNIYGTAEEAKDNYLNDCGRAFESTSAFRCDWVTGGWQCSGLGATVDQHLPDAPTTIGGHWTETITLQANVNTEGEVYLYWDSNSLIVSYQVYRLNRGGEIEAGEEGVELLLLGAVIGNSFVDRASILGGSYGIVGRRRSDGALTQVYWAQPNYQEMLNLVVTERCNLVCSSRQGIGMDPPVPYPTDFDDQEDQLTESTIRDVVAMVADFVENVHDRASQFVPNETSSPSDLANQVDDSLYYQGYRWQPGSANHYVHPDGRTATVTVSGNTVTEATVTPDSYRSDAVQGSNLPASVTLVDQTVNPDGSVTWSQTFVHYIYNADAEIIASVVTRSTGTDSSVTTTNINNNDDPPFDSSDSDDEQITYDDDIFSGFDDYVSYDDFGFAIDDDDDDDYSEPTADDEWGDDWWR